MKVLTLWRDARESVAVSTQVFLRDAGNGLLEASHNMLALFGLAVLAAVVFAVGREDVRDAVEVHALQWLQQRQEARAERIVAAEPETPAMRGTAQPREELTAVERATAADPRELPRQQAAVALWLARRYKVAPEPVSRLVQEAWVVGKRVGLDPTLILAVVAVESSFNPFAQSPVGAQGLMQVMTRVHDSKYERFGGNHAAFDPVANLRVGVQVLKECIARAGGSLEAGLRYYVGAANRPHDNGYAMKVLAEQENLRSVSGGKMVPTSAALPRAVPGDRRSAREADRTAAPGSTTETSI